MTSSNLTAGRYASWAPPLPLIGAKLLELRKRRTTMVVTALFTVALPVIFYTIRAIFHVTDPAHAGPAGQPIAFIAICTFMDEFGFIIAATLGATIATADLTDGLFRHLVITGRSRVALYLARIPAGLAILLPLAAAGFTVACLVTTFAHNPLAGEVVPSAGAMTRCGLWLQLDLIVGFTFGLGLGSLMGQRTIPVILIIVLQFILVPHLFAQALPHLINFQRLFVGVAMGQLKPAAITGGNLITFQGGITATALPPMPTWALITVISGWIIGWSAIGAWKMITRDA
jgi:hypothetical protein